jgi:antitoxin HigA-1
MNETEDEELTELSHPGEAILEDVMIPLGLTANALAKALKIPTSRIDEIVAGSRTISADTALRLGAYLGMRPEY